MNKKELIKKMKEPEFKLYIGLILVSLMMMGFFMLNQTEEYRTDFVVVDANNNSVVFEIEPYNSTHVKIFMETDSSKSGLDSFFYYPKELVIK